MFCFATKAVFYAEKRPSSDLSAPFPLDVASSCLSIIPIPVPVLTVSTLYRLGQLKPGIYKPASRTLTDLLPHETSRAVDKARWDYRPVDRAIREIDSPQDR